MKNTEMQNLYKEVIDNAKLDLLYYFILTRYGQKCGDDFVAFA